MAMSTRVNDVSDAFPLAGELLKGKRGLVMGVANDHSIAWGIARACAANGAELAFTYQGESLERRVRPLAQSAGSDFLLECDVENEESLERVFGEIERQWKHLDFLVHAIAFSDKSELEGRYLDTTRANFKRTMDISCFSFVDAARRAAPLMGFGGSLITLTYAGSSRVVPSYNVMGVAKAALEASVRYLASDLGPMGVRVNAISAGPMRTLAGSAVKNARWMYKWNQAHAPLKRTVTLDEVGGAALYLLSDLSGGVTGEVHHVDAGYSIVGIPRSEDMKGEGAG
ncbi:MAG: SDR family oxidoreductase [Alphaproteobacteria bacterium]